MKINNDIVIEKTFKDLKYLEFKKLTSLGVKNAYTLKDLDLAGEDYNLKKEENYTKLANALNIKKENFIGVYQSHSNNVLIIESDDDLKLSRDDFDAIITTRKDIALITKNADCILFIIYDAKKKILANIHSGWKGTLKRIIEKVLNLFQNRFKSDFNDIYTCISPSIRKCCFEVTEDVKNLFEKEFKEIDKKLYIQEKNIDNNLNENMINNRKYLIDTIYLNKYMMKKYGILEENIYDSNLCSMCNKEYIHSYRGAKTEEEKNKRGILIAKINE